MYTSHVSARKWLPKFVDESSSCGIDEIVCETALPEIDVLVVDRLDAPRYDPTFGWRPATKPTLLGDLHESVDPAFRR